MDTFGEWLHGQRSSLKLTRDEFADRVGCSVAMLRKIEDGERRPSTQIAELIANCLGIPLEERGTFLKVARGELSTERLKTVSKLLAQSNVSPAQAVFRSNLPVLPTPLIGRQHEVNELSDLLRDPNCRMLTLVGPGGIGKTRLAIETAFQCQNDFTDGVYFVALAPIGASRFVIPVIADAIGFTFQSESSLDSKSQLINFLGAKQILLLIDNLEHLLRDSEIIDIFAELMARTVKVKLLITSRESLGLQSESVFEVHGLPIPESTDMEGTSVELFLQRARRAYVGFDATTDDFPAILRICKLVNGMPLGIELAATWVRTLTCAEIAREIENGLDFLSVSAKDLPARHRSIRAIFDHSWKLLTEDEQKVLLGLSVFQGGFSREAAHQVAGATLAMLSALVTKSLIRRSGTGRFDQHELVRQYAFVQLQKDKQSENSIRDRHCDFYTSLLQQIEPRLKSSQQNIALAELGPDIENLRLAWNWAVVHGKLPELQRSVRCIQWFYDLRGWMQESATMFEQAANELDHKFDATVMSNDRSATVTLLRIHQGLAYVRIGRVVQGKDLMLRSLALAQSVSDVKLLSDNFAYLGLADYLTGDYLESKKHLEAALNLSSSIEYQWIEALSLMILGMLAQARDEKAQAQIHFHKSLEQWRALGSPRNIGSCLISYSLLLNEVGKYEMAEEMLSESLAIGRTDKDYWLTAISLLRLSQLKRLLGDAGHTESYMMAEESAAYFREWGDIWGLALALINLGEISKARGEYTEARKYFLEAIQKSIEPKIQSVTLEASLGLATLYGLDGSYGAAYKLVNAILQHGDVNQETRERAEKFHSELNGKLIFDEMKSAQTFTENISFEAVVKEILGKSKNWG